LKLRLLKMCSLTESMIGDAVRLLVDRDERVMELIMHNEDQVNRMQVEIDEMCLTLIALHQPAAGDLRFIMGVAKTNAEVERLADQAVNIAQKAVRLLKEPTLKPFVIIPQMAIIATGMVKDSLHAYVNRDVAKAHEVLRRDDELDNLKRVVCEEVLGLMRANPASVNWGLDVVLVAHNLERIGDHATNIAENAIFVAEGRDVRHHFEDNAQPRALPS
jgi:phosphate transport system protein